MANFTETITRTVTALAKRVASWLLQYDSCESLAYRATPEAIEILMRRAKNNNDVNVRESAVKALGKIGNPKAVPALIHAVENDPVWYVRLAAIKSLGKLDLTLDNELRTQVVDALLSALEKPLPWESIEIEHAIHSLARIAKGEVRVAQKLTEHVSHVVQKLAKIETPRNEYSQWEMLLIIHILTCIEAMGEIDVDQSTCIDALHRFILPEMTWVPEVRRVRYTAARAIAAIATTGSAKAIEILRNYTNDPDTYIATIARNTLKSTYYEG